MRPVAGGDEQFGTPPKRQGSRRMNASIVGKNKVLIKGGDMTTTNNFNDGGRQWESAASQLSRLGQPAPPAPAPPTAPS
eukprot:scaffold32264_cov52-Phaeocystis_antarctica.AAC.2